MLTNCAKPQAQLEEVGKHKHARGPSSGLWQCECSDPASRSISEAQRIMGNE